MTTAAAVVAAPGARRAGARAHAGPVAHLDAEVTAAEAGWTMWMVSHFHYDPVWWGTQGQFTESRLLLPDADGEFPDVRTAFELVLLHLNKAREDADYKFVLAEIDYLKPHFDAYPEDRADLRRFMADGRIEIVGGSYNEPNTNLTGAELTIRNAVYGVGFQRDVLGGDPRTAWMLDVFGHDPGYPGLMRRPVYVVLVGARTVPPMGSVRHRGRQPAHAVRQRVRVDVPGRPRPAHRVHGQPLRRRVGHAAAAGPGFGGGRGLQPVPPARRGRRDPQRDAAGRRGPRDPAALGHRHPPGPSARVGKVGGSPLCRPAQSSRRRRGRAA